MVKVKAKIRLIKRPRSVEVEALFDTGSGKSYVDEDVGKQLGYEPYDRPRKVPLAVEGRYAEVLGYIVVDIEMLGYTLPSKEILEVVRGLRENAIIGLNIIEPYGILLERERVRFREYPPRTYLI